MPSIVVNTSDPIPEVGDKAPVIHTPTKDEVGNISQIDTRVPPDDMHDVDFADVVGKQPIVLEFATPALCQSRVCGPVVDVAEQVKRDNPGRRGVHPHGDLQPERPQQGRSVRRSAPITCRPSRGPS